MEKPSNYVTVLLILLWSSCALVTPPPKPVDESLCQRACERITELGCPEAAPEPGLDEKPGTADDVPCTQWMCAADYLDYEAIASAESCDAALQ